MADSRSRTGNMQDESGTSGNGRMSTQKYTKLEPHNDVVCERVTGANRIKSS